MKNNNTQNRIIWVDNVKAIAIILVVLGHLFQSFVKSGIMQESFLFTYFNTFIYTFHVRLFFVCSGFLYQKTAVVNNFSSYKKNAAKKLIAFGVPYIAFSSVSFILKKIFADSVNSPAGNYFESLLLKPEAPFWFLYTLLIIFLITPTAKNKKSACLIFEAAAVIFTTVTSTLKFVPNSQAYVTFVYTTAIYLIWFALGILLANLNVQKLFSPYMIIPFIAAGIITYLRMQKYFGGTVLGIIEQLLACLGIIGFIGWIYKKNKQTPVFAVLSKYSMSVFLMHTIFAAGIRSVLLKLSVTNSLIHIAAGLIASFILPIIAQLIMEKIHLDILIFPLKYIKFKKSEQQPLF